MKATESGDDQQASAERRNVMIVDDHPLVRQGLATVLNRNPDLLVCQEAGSVGEAMKMLEQEKPDIILVDIQLQEMSGIELIKNVRALHETIPMLALSMNDETLYAERALRAGALGYVMKEEPINTILEAIRKVLDGEIWVSPRIANTLLRDLLGTARHQQDGRKSGVALLTDRELEIFQLIGRGSSTREIAASLKLGLKTVETHRAAIKSKLQLRSAIELI